MDVGVDDQGDAMLSTPAPQGVSNTVNGDREQARKDVNKFWLKQVRPLVDLAKYTNSMVVFLLGLYISLSIGRWWMLRSTHIQNVLKATRGLVFGLSAVLPGEVWDEPRQTCARYALLSHRLLFICARSRKSSVGEKDLAELRNEGLLTGHEFTMLTASMDQIEPEIRHHGGLDLDIAQVPWAWNCRLIHILFKNGAFSPPVMAMLHRLCLQARDGIEGTAMQLNSQLPFTYSHLIATLTQGAVILSFVKCGMAAALADSGLAIGCEILFTCSIAMVYLGLLSMTAVIADPFGEDIIDLPASHMQQQLWRGCSVFDALREVPSKFTIHRPPPPPKSPAIEPDPDPKEELCEKTPEATAILRPTGTFFDPGVFDD